MIFKIIIHIIYKKKDIFNIIPSYITFFFSYCILCLAQKKQKGQLFVMTAFLFAKETTIYYIYTILENPFYLGFLILLFRSYIIMQLFIQIEKHSILLDFPQFASFEYSLKTFFGVVDSDIIFYIILRGCIQKYKKRQVWSSSSSERKKKNKIYEMVFLFL